MKGFLSFLRKRIPVLRKEKSGFTLVDLLVVVGIIVALAAVIIPNVAGFAGKGTEGAKAAERDNIQTAIDTYMADQGLAALPSADANDTLLGSSSADFTTATGILDLETGTYLRTTTTTYFYCRVTTGKVTVQDEAVTVDCTRTN